MNRRAPLHVMAAAAGGLAAVLVLALAGPASAHVTVDVSSAPAGSFAFVNFSVPHGCEGSPTTGLALQIPDGVVSVKPEVTPGWEIATTEGPITPFESEGETVPTGIVEVTWTGGPLPDDRVQRFGMSLRLPDTPGETVYFPVVQTCEQGETAWIEIPEAGAEEPEHPAPAIELTAATGGDHGGGADTTAAPEAATTAAEATTTVVGADEGELAGGTSPSSNDDDGDGLAVAALVVGGLGLLTGAAGVALALRRR